MFSPWGWTKAREGRPCSLCDCLLLPHRFLRSPGSEIQSILFHDPCESCARDVGSSDCCAFCQHLRMRHLFICLSKPIFVKSIKECGSLENFAIELGSLATLESRKRCPLCRFFYDVTTARYRLQPTGIRLESEPLILKLSKDGPTILSCFKEEISRLFVHDIREHSSTPRTLSSNVHWSTLHQWKRKYMPSASLPEPEDLYNQHTSTPQLPQPLRVIDVDNGCVVSKSTGRTYAALSYVWGSPTKGDLQATLTNISALEKPGALKQAGIPLAILDAMTAASELEIPYLWADRLCIVQDDPTTKHDLINRMNSIYANALVTFVAGAGKDASYGLPGVSNKRSLGQAHIRIQGIELTEALPKFCDDILPRMVWMKRGWTYQEAMFSANLIFFTDCGVFYERRKASSKVLAEPPNKPGAGAFSATTDFFRCVEAYSGRNLSHETDIEKAFSGVLQSNYGSEHAYGSPFRFFDSALRWTPECRLRKPRQSTKNDIFPSWSWLSVMGRVDFSDARSPTWSLSVATWAMILPTADGKSQLRFIGFEKYGDYEINVDLIHVAWTGGFCKGKYPPHSNPNAQFANNLEPFSRYSPPELYEYHWCQIRGLLSTSAPTQLLFPEEYQNRLRPGQVLVHTRSACFPKPHSRNTCLSQSSSEDVRCAILREHGGLWDGEIGSSRCFVMDYSYDNLEELAHVEAIALSITDGRLADLKREDHWNRVGLRNGNLFERKDNCPRWRVDVMLIRRVGEVAYRMGLGWVSLETWIMARPTFETIILG